LDFQSILRIKLLHQNLGYHGNHNLAQGRGHCLPITAITSQLPHSAVKVRLKMNKYRQRGSVAQHACGNERAHPTADPDGRVHDPAL
jgi:hypothetical protein